MENRIDNAKKTYTAFIDQNQKLFHDLVSHPFMIETNQKYLDWLLSKLQDKKIDLSLKDIVNTLDKFNKYYGRLERKNIYSYDNIEDVQHALADYLTKEQKNKIEKIGLEVIVKTDDWTAVRIMAKDLVNNIDFPGINAFYRFLKKGMLFVVTGKKLTFPAFTPTTTTSKKSIVIFKPFGTASELEFYESGDKMYHQYSQQLLKNSIPQFVTQKIEAYTITHNEPSKFMTITEFNDLLYKRVVETYVHGRVFYYIPGSVAYIHNIIPGTTHKIFGNYITENNGLKLVYEVPYFNVRMYVDLHLFSPISPMTIETQDMTSKDEKKEKIFRLRYEDTAFKSKKLCFELLAQGKKGPEIGLKMIEFTIALLIEHPEFNRIYSGQMVYWGTRNYIGNELSQTKKRRRLRPTPTTDKFLEYVKEKEKKGQPATRRDFIMNVLGKVDAAGKPTVLVRSYLSITFAELMNAGIIRREKTKDGYTYRLGPNYEAYMEGRLRVAQPSTNPL